MYRRKISIALMILTIGTIAAFQVYWLRSNYKEEEKVFRLHTSLLFRETLFKIQASQMHLDTTFIQVSDPSGVFNMVRRIKENVDMDTTRRSRHIRTMLISIDATHGNKKIDSSRTRIHHLDSAKNSIDIVFNVDSLVHPISIKEASAAYTKALMAENILVPFTITATALPEHKVEDGDREVRFYDSTDNRVVLGFNKPMAYEVKMGNITWHITRRLAPQMLFSLILVTVTTLSFLLLFRNWQRQHKLTLLKNDFIGNITHELKTPIATVSVAVEALRNFNALQDPVRTREYLDISASELQRLSLLVDKVLKLSLFEKQEIELKKERFDLALLVKEVLASMRLQFEKYQAKVVFAEGEEAQSQTLNFQLKADKLHFTSVIFNLLDNALKYSRHNPSIKIDLAAEIDSLVLSVTDNGVGIPAIYRDRIFEKFFRVPTGDRHDVKGYGLGLSYVSYVIQRQGGEISVDSHEGIGSRFTVKIPREHA